MGTDINTMIEVRLEGLYQDYEEWVCAGSVDHLIVRNREVFAVLGNVNHYQDYERWVCAGSVDYLIDNRDNIKPLSCGRLTRKVVLTNERIAEVKKLYEEDENYRNDYISRNESLKEVYKYALHSDYRLSWAFIDRLIAEWEDGKCHDLAYVSYGCHDQSFVTLKEMMDYDAETTFSCEKFPGTKELWLELIDFIRKTGELYDQINPERIRLCFFFDS